MFGFISGLKTQIEIDQANLRKLQDEIIKIVLSYQIFMTFKKAI